MPDGQLTDSEVAALRHEIVESQKARIDLLKYKLVAIAALGAIGIGVYHAEPGLLRPEFIFILIPFVCVYVDAACWHNSLRILVIAQFFIAHKDRYEKFLGDLGETLKIMGASEANLNDIDDKKNPCRSGAGYFFRMEDWVLHYSTIIICISLIIGGLILFSLGIAKGYADTIFLIKEDSDKFSASAIRALQEMLKQHDAIPVAMMIHGLIFIVTALFGMLLCIYIKKQYNDTVSKLFETGDMLREAVAPLKQQKYDGRNSTRNSYMISRTIPWLRR